MKNILLLENDVDLLREIKDILTERQGNNTDFIFNVIACSNIYLANEALKKFPKIDIIVTDLNMPTNGLDESMIHETLCGCLTGWVWLKNYVLNVDKFKKTNVIIWSSYSELFVSEICSEADLNDIYGNSERSIKLQSKYYDYSLKKIILDLIK